MSPVELHRAWMVPPWVVKQGGRLNMPGGTTALLTWQYLLPQELSKRAKKKKRRHLPFGDGIAFLIASVLECSLWNELVGAAQFLWPALSPAFVTLHLDPKDGQFWPATRLQKLSSLFLSFPVFFPISAWLWWWWCYFAGFKCHSLKLELFTFFQVSPKE